jgi:hypothetical protein
VERQNQLILETKLKFNDLFLETVKPIFEDKSIDSFGWQQWDTDVLFSKYEEAYNTIHQADLNGNVGSLLYDEDSRRKQALIYEVLSKFDKHLLRLCFGSSVSVYVYSDLSIEIDNYDPYRLIPYEL